MVDIRERYPHNFHICDISFEQVGLLAYKVADVKDLHVLLAEWETLKRHSNDNSNLVKLGLGIEPAPKRRRIRQKSSMHKVDKVGNEDDGDSDEDDADKDDGDSDEHADKDDGDSDEDAGKDDALSCADKDDGDSDQYADKDACSAAPQVVVPPAVPQVRFDSDTGRVFSSDGDYLGRVSVAQPGEKNECLRVYCSRHGCNFRKRVTGNIPDTDEILQWFIAGQALPRDRAVGVQRRHKDLWPDDS